MAQLHAGADGLVLEEGWRRATFLPKVWSQLAEPQAFLRALKQKAGLPPDYWSGSLRFHRYSTHSFSEEQTTTPALATGEWVSFDLPLADFTGLTTTGAIAQLILSGDPNTVYVDNVYFYRTGGATEPAVAAPVPKWWKTGSGLF